MLEKKNMYILDDVLDSFREGQGKHVEKKGNEYNVTDLLGCRKKLEFKRAGIPYKFVESDITRQANIANFVHKAIQLELEKIGWITEQNEERDATKFIKKIGKYTIHMRADGLKGHYDYESAQPAKFVSEAANEITKAMGYTGMAVAPFVVDNLLEIKVPMWNSVAIKGIPDYYMLQVGMYLNITGAESCRLMVLAKNAFSEKVIIERLEDSDILWIIEHGESPWFDKECENCYYKEVCDVKKEKK